MNEIVVGSPYLLQFNLLTKCIFNCPYCYLRDLRHPKEDVLSIDDYKRFLTKFEKYYEESGLVLQVDLTGGDLWLYPQFEELLSFTSKLPYVKNIGLMLNSLWYEDAEKILKKFRKKLSIVQLNIDALENNHRDLEVLKSLDIPAVIKIMISNNKRYFEKQIKTLRKIRKDNIEVMVSVDRLCPNSNAQLPDLLDSDQVKLLLRKVISESGDNFLTDDPMILALINKKGNNNCEVKGCAIPNGGLTIFPNGDIKLCARIPDYDTGFTINNFDLWDYIKAFQPIMDKRKINCVGCELENICAGGCPATSFAKLGNIIGLDNNCIRQGRVVVSNFHNHKHIRTTTNPLVSCYLMAAGYYLSDLIVNSETEKEWFDKIKNTDNAVDFADVVLDAKSYGLVAEYIKGKDIINKIIQKLSINSLVIIEGIDNGAPFWWLVSGFTNDGCFWVTDPRLRYKQIFPKKLVKLLINTREKTECVSISK